MSSNPALNLAPFGRWTLHDKAAQRRLALRYRSIFHEVDEVDHSTHMIGGYHG